MRFYKPILTG